MPQRGDLIVVSLPGDFGKTRPAIVIQSDLYDATPTLTVIPLSSDLQDANAVRLRLVPSSTNGLRANSDIMVERIFTILREKAGPVFGSLTPDEMDRLGLRLSTFLGLA